MKLFSVKKEKKQVLSFFPYLLLLLVLTLLGYFSMMMSTTNAQKEKEILTNALERSITQCYALEGSYPPSVNYLKEHYGLTYDDSKYFIAYQYVGDNLRPDSIIIEKE